jgi:PHD/YefM family antitoxin component YafN of YafNO toxin-antitoxin module
MRTDPVTKLERLATERLPELEREGQPILITQNGMPRAYLVDVESYERLRQRVEILEGLVRSEAAPTKGRDTSHAEAGERVSTRLESSGARPASAAGSARCTESGARLVIERGDADRSSVRPPE